MPEAETRAGLMLKPQTFPLTVTNRPVMDVAFVQFLASVSGKVSCLGECALQGRASSSEIVVSGRSWDQVFLNGVAVKAMPLLGRGCRVLRCSFCEW